MDFGRYSGGVAFGAGIVGLGTGDFVAVGAGGGVASSTALLGEGSGAFFFVFEFSFAFAFRFSTGVTPPTSIGVSPDLGDGEALALTLGLADWSVAPPEGIPASASPVGGFAGSTGELFGSAVSVGSVVVALVGCELRVNA